MILLARIISSVLTKSWFSCYTYIYIQIFKCRSSPRMQDVLHERVMCCGCLFQFVLVLVIIISSYEHKLMFLFCFRLSVSAVVMSYLQNPQPMAATWWRRISQLKAYLITVFNAFKKILLDYLRRDENW